MKPNLLGILAAALWTSSAGAATVALWTFESPRNPPTVVGNAISGLLPNVGSGSAIGVHADAGTTFNSATGNGSLRALSANHWTVGDFWEFHVSTLNFQDLQLSFAIRSDNFGPTNFALSYSLDQTNFTTIGPSSFQVLADNSGGVWNSVTPNLSTIKTFDLSATDSLENAPDVYFRLTSVLSGGPSSGTSRVDDFSITATAVPEPAGLSVLAVGAVLFVARRRNGSPG